MVQHSSRMARLKRAVQRYHAARATQPTFSTLKGFSVIVLSPALSATMVRTHRFGRKILRTLLMMDLHRKVARTSVVSVQDFFMHQRRRNNCELAGGKMCGVTASDEHPTLARGSGEHGVIVDGDSKKQQAASLTRGGHLLRTSGSHVFPKISNESSAQD